MASSLIGLNNHSLNLNLYIYKEIIAYEKYILDSYRTATAQTGGIKLIKKFTCLGATR